MSSFKKVFVDSFVFADNVRTPECLALDLMVKSILENGWLEENTPVVNQTGEGGGINEVLQGNRRTLAIKHIQEHHPEEYSKVFPDGKLMCVVHKDLDDREKILLRVDHGPERDRYPLDEWSKYQAIQQLSLLEDLTQESIAQKLGLLQTRGKNKGNPNVNDVRINLNLARLPKFVEEEMRKYTLDKDSSNLRWSHVPRLYKAFRAEFADYPNGDGPKFNEVWNDCLNPTVTEDGNKQYAKALTPGVADKKAKIVQSEILKRILLTITEQGKDKLSDLDTQLVQMEANSGDLELIKEHLGEQDYNQFLDEVMNKEPEPTAV